MLPLFDKVLKVWLDFTGELCLQQVYLAVSSCIVNEGQDVLERHAVAVASPAVGDVAQMVSGDNRRFVTPAGDEAALSASLIALAADEGLRTSVGAANRACAQAAYDEKTMIRAYRDTYGSALGLAAFP